MKLLTNIFFETCTLKGVESDLEVLITLCFSFDTILLFFFFVIAFVIAAMLLLHFCFFLSLNRFDISFYYFPLDKTVIFSRSAFILKFVLLQQVRS